MREPYSAIRLLARLQPLTHLYNLRPNELAISEELALSAHGFCYALAAKKGYFMRGKKSLGDPDPHRAGLQVIMDTVDGAVPFCSDPAACTDAHVTALRTLGTTRALGTARSPATARALPMAAALGRRGEHVQGAAPNAAPRRAVLWLQVTLRVHDNLLLERALELGTEGLSIVVVWRHGTSVPNPAASFQAHAIRALHAEIRQLGSGLVVLHAPDATEASAAAAVADHALSVGATFVVVDAGDASGEHAPSLVAAALAAKGQSVSSSRPGSARGAPSATAAATAAGVMVVESMVDDTLFPQSVALGCLPASRTGVRHDKVLQWASFLKSAAALPAPPPRPAPLRLPAPLTKLTNPGAEALTNLTSPGAEALTNLTNPGAEALTNPDVEWPLDTALRTLPADSKRWAQPVLRAWREMAEGVDVSEAAGRQLAFAAGAAVGRDGRTGFAHATLGERAGAGDDVSRLPRPSLISPYLRWGVLSARQAEAAGVRRRDLLWRDFSRLCWRVVGPLRRGEPVTQALPVDDMTADELEVLARDAARERWSWTPPLVPPPLVPPPLTAGGTALPVAAPSWASLGVPDAFGAWCTGRTGAPLVDAGMRQLWACGWMPRRLRLLCASCLVEGMGLDWRLGRDWFAFTLIDHDPIINNCMWQNAGLVGVDPFYRGLRWETDPEQPERRVEHQERRDEPPERRSEQPPSPEHSPPEDDETDEARRYTRRWLNEGAEGAPYLPPGAPYLPSGAPNLPPGAPYLPPGAPYLPPWPPALRVAAAHPRPLHARVLELAAARRPFLSVAYRKGGRVSRVGIRVNVQMGARYDADKGTHSAEAEGSGARYGAVLVSISPPAGGGTADAAAAADDAAAPEGVGAAMEGDGTAMEGDGAANGAAKCAASGAAVHRTSREMDADGEMDAAWHELSLALERGVDATGEGAVPGTTGAQHGAEAHEAAARKLIHNHAYVLRDLTNPSRVTNINGIGLSQWNLERVAPEHALDAELALIEIARRLLGLPPRPRPRARPPPRARASTDEAEVVTDEAEDTVRRAVWAATARYLAGRIQASPEEMPGRTPDMSPAAASAMRAVLSELGRL